MRHERAKIDQKVGKSSRKKRLTVILCIITVSIAAYSCGTAAPKASGAADAVVKSECIHVLTPEQAEELYVGDVDWEAARNLGLAEGEAFSSEYLQAAAAYMTLFNYYLSDEYDFDDYQTLLDEQPYEYPAPEVDEGLSANGGFGRSNIFIRNTAYVERLSRSDLEMLTSAISGEELNITEELVDMAKATHRDVIEVKADGVNSRYEVLYRNAAIADPEIAPTDALAVILTYTYSYDEDGMIADTDAEQEKAEAANLLKDLMESELSTKLNMPVSVFVEN